MLSVILILLGIHLILGDILVDLPNGTIRGRKALTPNGTEFLAFQKIPYAAPPLGELRFKPPIPPQDWDGILDTTENTITCFQLSWDTDQETEDCLYLNVYTPALPDEDHNVTFPVMLWIHGGGFEEGDCLFSNVGPEFLIEHELVIVTINYRLGAFGFLSTGDLVAPGNAGLKDQRLAIQWTHENIHLFNGNPDRLILFGESAGGASVAYHLLDKEIEGLFHGAIIESGSFLSPWAYQRNARSIAFKTAGYINETFNDIDDSEELFKFLQSVPARDLDRADYLVKAEGENPRTRQMSQGFFFAPVVEPEHEGAFITERMYVSLVNGDFNRVPIMIGICSEECVFEASNYDSLRNELSTYDENPSWLVPDDMEIEDEEFRTEVGEKIRQFYCGNQLFQEDLASGVRYFTDTSFARAQIRHGEVQSQFTDVYFYQFSYDGIIGNNSAGIEGADKVSHGEEIRYIWRTYFEGYDNSNLTDFPLSDQLTFHRVQALWSNFAKYLNPTPEKSDILQNVIWPKVSTDDGDYLYLDIGDDLIIKNHPKEQTYQHWVDLYDSLSYDDFDTY